MAFCLHIAARGQTGYDYDYWFDNDRSTLRSGSSESGSWKVKADLSGLDESLHAIHLQVCDKGGNYSSPITRYFMKLPTQSASKTRYWFDDDDSSAVTTQQFQSAIDVDVAVLPEGFHTLRLMVTSEDGTPSTTFSRHFYKVNMPTKNRWHCWFDNDTVSTLSGDNIGETIVLEVTHLADGYHVLHTQIDGPGGRASVPVARPFIKIPQVIGVDYLTCLCIIDDQLYKQERVSANGGIVNWQFDVSSLPQGLHRMYVQVVTPSGVATSAYQALFVRETTPDEFTQMKCVYAIDGVESFMEAGQLADGTFHFDLDVSTLSDGLHRIAYVLSNGKGVTTNTQSQFFVKTPLGGNGIAEYWYWQNDQADSLATKVKLPERQNPFSLITLLPVESLPLRTSLFQFCVENNQPVVYAKNDFHIRFYDATGCFVDTTSQYVDERVRQEITDITLLKSGVRETTAKPEEGKMKWYKVVAASGDSLRFKLDREATMQLFSPSGNELFSVSGAISTDWSGCHAEETGSFYLALHDMTDTQGATISIDYEHIAKDPSPTVIGDVNRDDSNEHSIYHASGQRAKKGDKGLLIKKGKKYVAKKDS